MVNSIELSVVGGPSTVNVDVDLGAPGVRGSLFYAYAGNPVGVSDATLLAAIPGSSFQTYDLILNIATSSATYRRLYQRMSDGTWQEVVDLGGS